MFKNSLKKQDQETAVIAPRVNIYEQNQQVVLAVEMPGIDKKDLDVQVEGSRLKIAARKAGGDVPKEYSLVYGERVPAEYRREFELNADVDTEKIEAQYEDGVLKVFLARALKAQPRKIEISS